MVTVDVAEEESGGGRVQVLEQAKETSESRTGRGLYCAHSPSAGWALIFLRRPLKLVGHALPHQQRKVGSARHSQASIVDYPRGKDHRCQLPAQAKNSNAISGPRDTPITDDSTHSGALRPR